MAVTRKLITIRVIVSLLGAICLLIAAAIPVLASLASQDPHFIEDASERIILWDQVAKYALTFAILGILCFFFIGAFRRKRY